MLTGRWQTWDESAAGQSFCLPYLTYIYGAVPIPRNRWSLHEGRGLLGEGWVYST